MGQDPAHLSSAPVASTHPMAAGLGSGMAGVLALGADGRAGQLEPAVQLSDGTTQQLTEIKNEFINKLLGGTQQLHVHIIRNKSGASMQVLDANAVTTFVRLSGNRQAVSLAAQMVQEILVNGIDMVQSMPDVSSTPAQAPTLSPAVSAGKMLGFPSQVPPPPHTAGGLSPRQERQTPYLNGPGPGPGQGLEQEHGQGQGQGQAQGQRVQGQSPPPGSMSPPPGQGQGFIQPAQAFQGPYF